jgi:RNA polymerase sigma-70 factor (ECF subfamily)
LADGQLLERYVLRRDEAAFAALADRYGSLVLGVCERVLQNSHDAEDAFQATFLVLARRADRLDRRGPLGNWLYTVAYRTAAKLKADSIRRHAHERNTFEMAASTSTEDQSWDELRPVLDEELNQLPEKYRAPLVLCCLEGKSHQQAARELGWPSGSMSRRMTRARELLRRRLVRRGVTVSAALILLLLTKKATATTVPAGLAAVTVRAAVQFGSAKAGASMFLGSKSATLAQEIARTALGTTKTSQLARPIVATILLLIIGVSIGAIVVEVVNPAWLGGGVCVP